MKIIKWIVIVLAVLVTAAAIFWQVAKHQTKKHSPSDVATYVVGDLDISVSYCRPFKKNRQIFDSLVPYGVTWRTGANEPTVFKTNQDIKIADELLEAGEYTLWTVPNADEWEVVWNKKMYDWGVSLDGLASREPGSDALIVAVPTEKSDTPVEQLTISFRDDNGSSMVIEWDKTIVVVPFTY